MQRCVADSCVNGPGYAQSLDSVIAARPQVVSSETEVEAAELVKRFFAGNTASLRYTSCRNCLATRVVRRVSMLLTGSPNSPVAAAVAACQIWRRLQPQVRLAEAEEA
jgi:hypothetical protein